MLVLPIDLSKNSNKRFYCHVCCRAFSVLEVAEKVLRCSTDDALAFVCKFISIEKPTIDYTFQEPDLEIYLSNALEALIQENKIVRTAFKKSYAFELYKYLLNFSFKTPRLKDFPYYKGAKVFFWGIEDMKKALGIKNKKRVRLALDILILTELLTEIPLSEKPERYQAGFEYDKSKGSRRFVNFKNHYTLHTFSEPELTARVLQNIENNKVLCTRFFKNGSTALARLNRQQIRKMAAEKIQ